MTVKISVDLTEFTNFTKKAPGVMDGIVKESFSRGAAKLRKEFIKTIDRGTWSQLQKTPKYRSKYSKPLQVMKAIIRYRVTGGYKRVTATIGVFPGKAGRDRINGAEFKAKYGITLNRFAKLMTYGGTLRINPADRKRLVREGFYVSNRTKTLKFPRRDWYTPTAWKNPATLIPYINKDLDARVERKLQNGKF